jgi:hypothetical protein
MDLSHIRIKPKLVFGAFPLSMQHYGVKALTSLVGNVQ